MSYNCDICGDSIKKYKHGFIYSTTQVTSSVAYWKKMIRDLQIKVTWDEAGSNLAEFVLIIIKQATPWLVCKSCTSIICGGKKEAKKYAKSNENPPGSGPACYIDASITAGQAWSLIYNEWPTSIMIGENPIIHDPQKGSRCDFCRRIIYGKEQLSLLTTHSYNKLLSNGKKFIRNPKPKKFVKEGRLLYLSCLTCLDKDKIQILGIETLEIFD